MMAGCLITRTMLHSPTFIIEEAHSSSSCGDALKDLFHSKLMLHVMSGIPMKNLNCYSS